MRSDLEVTADNAARLALELGAMRTRLVAAEAALADANAQLEGERTKHGCTYQRDKLAKDLAAARAQLADANAEIARLIAEYATHEKANIASRRSICEQSDRYNAQLADANAELAELREHERIFHNSECGA